MEENEHSDFIIPPEIREKAIAFLSAKTDSGENRTIHNLFRELEKEFLNQFAQEIKTSAPGDYGSIAIDKVREILKLYHSFSKIIGQGTPYERNIGSPSHVDLVSIRRLPEILEDIVEHYADYLSPGIIANASILLQEYNKIFPTELRRDGR